jgi:hypothetical protein
MTLHFTQIFFTDARTFIVAALLRASADNAVDLFGLLSFQLTAVSFQLAVKKSRPSTQRKNLTADS